MAVPNRLDQTGPNGARLSTNLSIDRQTPKSDFGDRINDGMNYAVGNVANGFSMAAPLVPGGAIVSAAVSSLNTLPQRPMAMQYMGSGMASGIAGPGGRFGSLSTTVSGAAGPIVNDPLPPTSTPVPGSLGSVGIPGGMMGTMNGGLMDTAADLGQMLQVQMQIQRENQVFTTVSNVLKTRHDTVKNTIANVR